MIITLGINVLLYRYNAIADRFISFLSNNLILIFIHCSFIFRCIKYHNAVQKRVGSLCY